MGKFYNSIVRTIYNVVENVEKTGIIRGKISGGLYRRLQTAGL